MAYKRITLKDPVTGDFLIPSTGGLEYIPTPDGAVPPFELIKDADTLQGHTADEFAKVSDINFNGIGNEYVWAKEEYVEKLSTISDNYIADCDSLSTYIVRYSSEISISSSGSVSMINPQDAQFKAGSSDVSMLVGKYYYKTTGNNVIDTSNIRKIPENATIQWSNGRQIYVQSTPVYTVSSELQPVCYVNSPDPNAYPPAVSDGYTYTPLGRLGKKVQIDTGTYEGTGDTNSVVLTFSGTPSLVIIARYNTNTKTESNYFWIIANGVKQVSLISASNTANCDWSGNKLTLTNYSSSRINEQGYSYMYHAFII